MTALLGLWFLVCFILGFVEFFRLCAVLWRRVRCVWVRALRRRERSEPAQSRAHFSGEE